MVPAQEDFETRGARSSENLDIIFNCSVCHETLNEIYARKESNKGFGNGQQPDNKLVKKLWLIQCGHLVCAKHLEGGGVPFHPEGERPQVKCPKCRDTHKDDAPKSLFAVRGLAAEDHDERIPSDYFECPPRLLQEDYPGMDALRFQYLSLTSYSLAVTQRLRSASTKLSQATEQLEEHSKMRRSQDENIQEMKQRIRTLEKAEAALAKYKQKEPEIRHYLKAFTEMAKELDERRLQLSSLGYDVPRIDYRYCQPGQDQEAKVHRTQLAPEQRESDIARHLPSVQQKGGYASASSETMRGSPPSSRMDETHGNLSRKRNYDEYLGPRPSPQRQDIAFSKPFDRQAMPPPQIPASKSSPDKARNGPHRAPLLVRGEEAMEDLNPNRQPEYSIAADARRNQFMHGIPENDDQGQRAGQNFFQQYSHQPGPAQRHYDNNDRSHIHGPASPIDQQRRLDGHAPFPAQNSGGSRATLHERPDLSQAYNQYFHRETLPSGHDQPSYHARSNHDVHQSNLNLYRESPGHAYYRQDKNTGTDMTSSREAFITPRISPRQWQEQPAQNIGNSVVSPFFNGSAAAHRTQTRNDIFSRTGMQQNHGQTTSYRQQGFTSPVKLDRQFDLPQRTANGLSFIQEPYPTNNHLSQSRHFGGNSNSHARPSMILQTPRDSNGLFTRFTMSRNPQPPQSSRYNASYPSSYTQPRPLMSAQPLIRDANPPFTQPRSRPVQNSALGYASGSKEMGSGSGFSRGFGNNIGSQRSNVFSSRRSIRR